MSDTNETRPVGRSYSNEDWEPYAGEFSTLSFSCDAIGCEVDLLTPASGSHYILTAYEHTLPADDEAARFLERASFGPTKAEIAAFTTPLDYVVAQLALDPTSHRQYFRERVTDWHPETTTHGLLHTHPCNQGARYRAYAFTVGDDDRYVNITTNENGNRELAIDGILRTVVESVHGGQDDEIEYNITDGG